jgi:thioesterase domain-containing protein
VGLPITNTTAYVVDRFDRPVPVGVVGECLLGGVAVARGYLNRPELTAARFVDLDLGDGVVRRVYRTGDLVKRRVNGELEFVGRIDDQVKVRGYRIELGEIESRLQAHPRIAAGSVIVRQDTPGDKRLVGYIVPAGAGDAQPDTGDLRVFLGLALPEYMVPSVFVTLDALPLTPNGKVDRKALPAPGLRERGADDAYSAPRTELEHTLAAIWSELLNVTPVGIHDNFFHLVGHSITAVRVCSRISAAGHSVRLQQIMRHSTVATLAEAISGPSDAPNSLIVRLSTSPSASSSRSAPIPRLFCVHPGGGSTHSYRGLASRLAGVFDLHGIQASGLNPGETPIDSVPEMAERYWREIRAVQPGGPYLLLGWSTGAVVAHAMGVLRPDEITQVYLLEPAVTGPGRRPVFDHYAGVYRRVSELWELGRRQTGAQRAAVEAELRRMAPAMNIEAEAVTLDQWLPYDVLGAEVRALAADEPAPSRVGATLFVSATVREGSGDEVPHADYLAHWDRLYPAGLEVRDLPGPHLQMVKGVAQLDALAEVLAAHRERRPALA